MSPESHISPTSDRGLITQSCSHGANLALFHADDIAMTAEDLCYDTLSCLHKILLACVKISCHVFSKSFEIGFLTLLDDPLVRLHERVLNVPSHVLK